MRARCADAPARAHAQRRRASRGGAEALPGRALVRRVRALGAQDEEIAVTRGGMVLMPARLVLYGCEMEYGYTHLTVVGPIACAR